MRRVEVLDESFIEHTLFEPVIQDGEWGLWTFHQFHHVKSAADTSDIQLRNIHGVQW